MLAPTDFFKLGVPFLGFAPFFGLNPQDTFYALHDKYGKIFSMYMGRNLTIVLNDYEAIKAAFVDQEEFLGRPDSFVINDISTGKDGKIHGKQLNISKVFNYDS